MVGKQRTNVINHASLIAVEARCFNNANLKSKQRRAIDIFGGSHPDYPRRLAVYQSSDNPSGLPQGGHGLDGIGELTAHFKMQKINLESLRQCFLDSDVRIRQDFEFERHDYPRIGRVTLSGGFLAEQSVDFNQGLNSIIGGKGTGKSLLVEFMRFALDQSPDRPEIMADHNRKLETRLRKGNYVELEFIDETRKSTTLKRTYDPVDSYYKDIGFEPSKVFPVLFLSQNEIMKIAEDELEQLDFIDRFFDFRSFRYRILTIERSIAEFDIRLADSIRAVAEAEELESQISTNSIELERLDLQLKHSIFEEYQLAGQKNQTIIAQIGKITDILDALSNSRDTIAQIDETIAPKEVAEDPLILRNMEIITKAKLEIQSKLGSLIEAAARFQSQIEIQQTNWNTEFNHLRTRYDEYVRAEGGNYQELASQREQVHQQRQQFRDQMSVANAKRHELTVVKRTRDEYLDSLAQEYDRYRATRELRCNYFQQNSNGRLRLGIKGSTNIELFKERLVDLKTGSRLTDADIDTLVHNCTPREFIDSVIDFQVATVSASAGNKPRFSGIARLTSLSENKMERLLAVLADDDKLEPLLELQYKAHPQDRPEITYNVGDNTFVPLGSLSVGQKSTALLIMALSDGSMPVVIDQPEDSLDIRSIWDDICSKVRIHKNQRQFIFTTHNSNVAVASDSDNYVILEANSENGRIVHRGSMDHSPVADEVLRYMEGGVDSYRRKSTKYQTDD